MSDASSRTILEKGRFDGIVRRSNGSLLITDWGVKGNADAPPALHRVGDEGTGSVTTTNLSEWKGPADFDCAEGHGCWIPDLPGSAVEVIRPGERME